MKFHLNRGGQSLGQFTPEEVLAGYKEGRFVASDLAWRDGMASWEPLGKVLEELTPEVGAESEALHGATLAHRPPEGLPWEQRAERGFLHALIETIRLVLLEPSSTFRAMSPTGGLGAPLFFYVLCATVGALVSLGFQVAFNKFGGAAANTPEQRAIAEALASTVAIGGTIVVLPVLLAAGIFVLSGITHLALMLVGGAKKPFEATFRVLCYAGGATSVVGMLPVCGGIIAGVWNVVLMVFGLSEVHGISKGKAFLAVLLPLLVCCVLIFGVGFLLAVSLGDLGAALKATGK